VVAPIQNNIKSAVDTNSPVFANTYGKEKIPAPMMVPDRSDAGIIAVLQ
jgi:hypothetical protein